MNYAVRHATCRACVFVLGNLWIHLWALQAQLPGPFSWRLVPPYDATAPFKQLCSRCIIFSAASKKSAQPGSANALPLTCWGQLCGSLYKYYEHRSCQCIDISSLVVLASIMPVRTCNTLVEKYVWNVHSMYARMTTCSPSVKLICGLISGFMHASCH